MSHEKDLSQNEARALRRLADELRSAPAPDLDWDRIEGDLMRRTELEAAARRKRGGQSAWGSVGAFAAAAAAVVLLIAGTAQRNVTITPDEVEPTMVDVRSLPTFPGEPDALPKYQVGAVAPNSAIESGVEPVQLAVKDVATWTLAPNSRAVIRSTKVPHVVELERGMLFAEVVPRYDTDAIVEAFVVEVEGTRVAVRGTVFSVERVDDMVNVEVTRGSVTVGPSSYRGATTGLVLTSPARAMFRASTGAFVKRLPLSRSARVTSPSDAQDPKAPTAALEPVAPRNPDEEPEATGDDAPREPQVSGSSTPPPSASTKPDPTQPNEPAEKPKLTSGQAAGIISSCLKRHAKETFVITSTVNVHLGADGEVMSLQFTPPLNPRFQAACGSTLFGKQLEGEGSVTFGVSSK